MPFPVEVMSVGTWKQTKFTLETLKEIAGNFKKLKEVIKPPVKLGHSETVGAPALGWVTDMKVKGNKLFAYLDNVPEVLMTAIKKKLYRRVSSEIMFGFKYKGKNFGKVFSGLALLGAEVPAVKDLEDLTAYLTQTSEGEFESIAVFEIQNENIIHRKDKTMPTNEDFEKFQEQLNSLNTKILTLTQDIQEKDKQIETLQKEVDISKANEKKLFRERKKEQLTIFFEDQVKAGIMTPAQRDMFTDDHLIFQDDGSFHISFAVFQKFVEAGKKKRDDNHYTNDDDPNKKKSYSDPQDEVMRLAGEYQKANKVDFSEAIQAVLSDPENKDLAEKYTDDYSAVIDG